MSTMTPLPAGMNAASAEDELNYSGHVGLRDGLVRLAADAADGRDISHVICHLDWAAQLRAEGMTWSDALRAAEVAYYG